MANNYKVTKLGDGYYLEGEFFAKNDYDALLKIIFSIYNSGLDDIAEGLPDTITLKDLVDGKINIPDILSVLKEYLSDITNHVGEIVDPNGNVIYTSKEPYTEGVYFDEEDEEDYINKINDLSKKGE